MEEYIRRREHVGVFLKKRMSEYLVVQFVFMCRQQEQLSRYLFKVAVLAGPLLGVLVVDDVQRTLPLFQLQTFNLRLQLVQLLLQVLALFHVFDPKHGRVSQLVSWSLFSMVHATVFIGSSCCCSGAGTRPLCNAGTWTCTTAGTCTCCTCTTAGTCTCTATGTCTCTAAGTSINN